jgi:hypothetical protein
MVYLTLIKTYWPQRNAGNAKLILISVLILFYALCVLSRLLNPEFDAHGMAYFMPCRQSQFKWDYAFDKLCPQMKQVFADEQKQSSGEISCVSSPPAFSARQSAVPARRRLCLRSHQFFRRILSKPLFHWPFRKYVVKMRFNQMLMSSNHPFVCSSLSIFRPNDHLGAPIKGL